MEQKGASQQKERVAAQAPSDDLPPFTERARMAFENAPIGMAIVGLDFRLQRVNASLCEALGYSESELLDRNFIEISHPDDIKKDTALAHQLFRGEIPSYRLEKRFIMKDGRLVWLDLTAIVLHSETGEILCGMAMVENITARKNAEETLRTSEERYRAFVVNSSEAIWRFEIADPIDTDLPLDKQLRLLYEQAYLAECNDATARLHGYDRADDLIGLSVGDLFPTSEPSNVAACRAFLSRSYRLNGVESTERDGSGFRRFFLTSVIGIVLNKRLFRVWGVQRDITERKYAEEQLEASREQLRALTAHIQSVREDERTHLAREIHDVVGQGLTGLKIDMSWINKKLSKELNETTRLEIEQRVAAAIELIERTSTAAKNICAALRPRVLDTFGLAAAVDWQCFEFEQRTGIACSVRTHGEEQKLHEEIATALFRIFQEALTNVSRHADARRVFVELQIGEAEVMLSLRDDGRGATEDEIWGVRSLGFLGMRERAALLGGDVYIKGKRGEGTAVTVRIPITTRSAS
jgi:PAS domain S-box-containing protein